RNQLSPWNHITYRDVKVFGQDKRRYHIAGVAVLDYLQLYQKYSDKKQESYKLDNIAFVELGERKLTTDDSVGMHLLYKKDYPAYCEYSVHDVTLVKKRDEEMKLLDLAMVVAYNARCNFEDIFAQT